MSPRPFSSDRVASLESILASILRRIDAGETPPTPAELQSRYPDFADALIEYFHDELARTSADPTATTSLALPSFAGFETLELLGRGGCGAVYRARDVQLDRDVAIKVLNDHLAQDEHWRSRFEREGLLLAALQHPNIGMIFAVGDGGRWLVMELVGGPTLEQHLVSGPLPQSEAIEIAFQIAEALEAAHAQGIIHRDLKPANVKLGPDGQVKVIDFGLARRGGPASAACLTAERSILGTPAYMSPQQARGEPVDKRTDIWSYGAILYEMLAGRRAFSGHSAMDCLAAAIDEEPDWSALAPMIDARLLTLVRRCLRKDAYHRLHDIADARIELAEIASTLAVTNAPALRPWRGELMLGRPAAVSQPAVSPDGQLLAYMQIDGRLSQIGLMNRKSGHRRLLTTDRQAGSAFHPSWSPDGAWVYFARADATPRGVYRVAVTDGHCEQVLENADSPQPLADGSLLAGHLGDDGQYRVLRYWPDANRREVCPTPIVQLYDELNNVASFRAISDGRRIVCWRRQGNEPPRLFVMDLRTGDGRYLDPDICMGALACPIAVPAEGQDVVTAFRRDSREALRVVAVPLHPGLPARTLLTIPGGCSGLAVDTAGDLYLSITQSYSELLRVPRTTWTGRPERLTQGGAEWEVPTALPDGRILFGESTAGRHRIVTVADQRPNRTFVQTSEETWLPAAIVDPARVVLGIGPADARDLAMVEIRSGRILKRYHLGLGAIASLAAAPGGTLYFAASNRIYALAADGDEPPRHIGNGTSAALDVSGSLLVISTSVDGPRLCRLPLDGGPSTIIPIAALHHLPITGNATGPDGRALVLTMPGDRYFNLIALVDPLTGAAEQIDLDYDGDLFAPTHGLGGEVLAVGRPFQSEIWWFQALGRS
jgi:serine/threonine protein kinase